MEKVSPVEKRYDPMHVMSPTSQYGPPQTPAIPPNSLPKLGPNEGKFVRLSPEAYL
jgi:hypothetical protein